MDILLKDKAIKFKLQNLQPEHFSLFPVELSSLKKELRLEMYCNRLMDWIKIKYFIHKSCNKDQDFKVLTDLKQAEVILDSKIFKVLSELFQLSQLLNRHNNRKINWKELWIQSHKLYMVFLQAMDWEQELRLHNKIFLNPLMKINKIVRTKIKLLLVYMQNNLKIIIKMSIWMLTLWKLVLLALYKEELGQELQLWLLKVILFDRYLSKWLV